MSKARTFSRTFPVGHDSAGNKTLFVEKILNTLDINYSSISYKNWLINNNPNIDEKTINDFFDNLEQTDKTKSHTVRKGQSIKKGELVSFRVWSEKPYRSKQIKFAPDIKVNIFPVKFDDLGFVYLNDSPDYLKHDKQSILAKNDGLTNIEFMNWFFLRQKPFKGFEGQVICWDSKIEY